MGDNQQAPTGLGRRGRRLPDEELRGRMLRAAAAMVHRAGLTVSLDHISFEDVIRAADVSRSAAYRRWPYKDLFYGDLIEELAKEGAPPGIVQAEYALIQQVVREFPGKLDTPGQRHELLTELFRRLALLDFQALADSPEWQTYIALQAAFNSIADAERRGRVRAALAAAEQERRGRVAAAWELLADLFGYRIRPETGATFDTLITLVDAALRGLIIMAQPVPGIAASTVSASPFGATTAREWSLPALGAGSVATAFLEPDPAITWDDERVARIRQLLSSPNPLPVALPDLAPGLPGFSSPPRGGRSRPGTPALKITTQRWGPTCAEGGVDQAARFRRRQLYELLGRRARNSPRTAASWGTNGRSSSVDSHS